MEIANANWNLSHYTRKNSRSETKQKGISKINEAAIFNRLDAIVFSDANYPKWGKLLPLTQTHWEAVCLIFWRETVFREWSLETSCAATYLQ